MQFKSPLKSSKTNNKPTIGYIDYASSTRISGWIRRDKLNCSFFIEQDGIRSPVSLRLHAREDLIAQEIDGLGFEFHFIAQREVFSLSFGYTDAALGKISHVPFSETGEYSKRVAKEEDSLVFIDSKDLQLFADAIDADSIAYLRLVQKYGHSLGTHGKQFDVLFVDGTNESISIRYRILNIADGLKAAGYTTRYVSPSSTSIENILLFQPRVVVFFRAPLDDNYHKLLREFKSKGILTVFDIDDLVIDEDIITDIDGVRFLDHDTMAQYANGVRLYKDFAQAVDVVTTATVYLAKRVTQLLGKKAVPIRNSIGPAYLDIYSNPPQLSEYVRREDFVIGYYPGSRTHQRDFEQAYKGIVEFMRTYSDTVLRIVGMLDLEDFPDLQPLKHRIVTLPIIPFYEMIEDLSNCDVILAPLVVGDPFCESKSELKFFEAALRCRPCIASATETYSTALKNGKLGYLASTDEDWMRALKELYLSPEKRFDIANAAHRDAILSYSFKQAGLEAAALYFNAHIPSPPPRKPTKIAAVANIGVIIPGLVIGGGGHRKILRFCKDWAESGINITLYVDSTDAPGRIAKQISTHFYDFPAIVKNYRGIVDKHDAIVCTHWSTAYSLRNFGNPQNIFYFVQDYEPMFEPVSTNYVKASATYQLGFNIATYGRWVTRKIESEYGLRPSLVEFTMDRSTYKPNARCAKTIDVLFFARPSQPRRCFELGVEALRLVHRANPAIRIALFGENSYGDLGFTYHNFGLVTDVSKLAHIYNKARLGICFSTTNPSLVGYEMAACGLPLLDLELPGYEANFDGESFVYYSLPTAEAVATTIAAALRDEGELNARAQAGLKFVAGMPSDENIALDLMNFIESVFQN